jgi:hypothetical protein
LGFLRRAFGAALKFQIREGRVLWPDGDCNEDPIQLIGEMSTQPTRPGPKPKLDDDTKAVLTERLKRLEKDRENARPADEVFRRILQKPQS